MTEALATVLTALWTCDQLSCRDQLLDCDRLFFYQWKFELRWNITIYERLLAN